MWHSEVDPGACRILDHHWPDVPNLGDITTIDWSTVPTVDIIAGGFPCTDLSAAGAMAGLMEGTRSGLWTHMATAINVLRPRLVIVENVRGMLSTKAGRGDAPDPPLPSMLALPVEDDDAAAPDQPWDVLGSDDEDLGGDVEPGPVLLRALGAVLGDLADIGYDAAWCGLRAADVGAPHGRFRVFIIAWPTSYAEDHGLAWARDARDRRAGSSYGGIAVADTDREQPERGRGPGVLGSPSPTESRETRQRERAGDTARGSGQADTGPDGDAPCGCAAWGQYASAIHRWELILGRPAPAPTESGKNGPRLSPRAVEFMMGLPFGWVCDVPGVSRNDQLKMLGNGVVWQQAETAIRRLLDQVSPA